MKILALPHFHSGSSTRVATQFDFTSTHLWYSDGMFLRSLDLSTLADKVECIFRKNIICMQTNATRCIVKTAMGLCLQQSGKWTRFATNVAYWILTPTRVVYEQMSPVNTDMSIISWDFINPPTVVAHGLLHYASCKRVLWHAFKGPTMWQDGELAEPGVMLRTDDVEYTGINMCAPPRPPYILDRGGDGEIWLIRQ